MTIISHSSPAYQALAKTARDFEGAQLGALFQTLFETVKGEGPMGDGAAGGVFRTLMVNEMADSMAAQGGIGLAAPVYEQLLRLQGLPDIPAPSQF